MVTDIAERSIESDDEDNGEGEVVSLAGRCLDILGKNPKNPKTLVEG